MYFGSILQGMKPFAALAVMAAVLMPFPAHAAKADCTKASSKLDQMLCSDPTLVKVGERMTASFERTLKVAGNPEALRKEQGEWQEGAVSNCDDSACLREAYTQRTNQLDLLRVAEERKAKNPAKPK